MQYNNTNIYNQDESIKNNNQLLITIEDSCKLLNLGRNTMLKLAKTKGFPAIILPGKILIDRERLPEWIRKNYGKYSI